MEMDNRLFWGFLDLEEFNHLPPSNLLSCTGNNPKRSCWGTVFLRSDYSLNSPLGLCFFHIFLKCSPWWTHSTLCEASAMQRQAGGSPARIAGALPISAQLTYAHSHKSQIFPWKPAIRLRALIFSAAGYFHLRVTVHIFPFWNSTNHFFSLTKSFWTLITSEYYWHFYLLSLEDLTRVFSISLVQYRKH